MNPFDAPPSTPPVSLESPAAPPAPRRGRMALVAVASTGLLAAGVIGVSALATADDPPLDPVDAAADAMLSAAADDDPGEGEAPAPDENDRGGDGDEGGDGTDGNADDPSLDGEIRIETGDGDPIVIDLGELGSLDGEAWERFRECADLPMWLDGDLGGELGDLDLRLGDVLDDPELEAQFDELFGEFESMFDDFPADLDVWLDGWLDDSGLLDGSMLEQEPGAVLGGPGVLAEGGAVTVLGPDGVTIVDLGDGDGSVTVTRDGDTGELTITTDGTATEQQLDDLFGDLPVFDGDFEFPEFDGDFEFPALPGLEGLDPERINDCLSELG